jgi:hypothetical protein
MGIALIQRRLTGFNDVLRGVKIGLANFQVDDIASLSFERPSFD